MSIGQESPPPPPPSELPAPFWQTDHFFNIRNIAQDTSRIRDTVRAFYQKWSNEPLSTAFRDQLKLVGRWVMNFERQMQSRHVVGAQLCYLDEGFNLLLLFLKAADDVIRVETEWNRICNTPGIESDAIDTLPLYLESTGQITQTRDGGGWEDECGEPISPNQMASLYRECSEENLELGDELTSDILRVIYALLGCDERGIHLFLNYMRWFKVALPPAILQEVRWRGLQNLDELEVRCRQLSDFFSEPGSSDIFI